MSISTECIETMFTLKKNIVRILNEPTHTTLKTVFKSDKDYKHYLP